MVRLEGMSEPKRAPPTLAELSRPINFKLTLEEQLRGLEGLPSYLVRKRRIEETIEKLVGKLRRMRTRAWEAWPDRPELATAQFFDEANALSLESLAQLIRSHNQYYPIEANLPIEVRTGYYLERGGERWRPMRMLRLDDLLALLWIRRRWKTPKAFSFSRGSVQIGPVSSPASPSM